MPTVTRFYRVIDLTSNIKVADYRGRVYGALCGSSAEKGQD